MTTSGNGKLSQGHLAASKEAFLITLMALSTRPTACTLRLVICMIIILLMAIVIVICIVIMYCLTTAYFFSPFCVEKFTKYVCS